MKLKMYYSPVPFWYLLNRHATEATKTGNVLLNVENRNFSQSERFTFESEEGKGFKAAIWIPL